MKPTLPCRSLAACAFACALPVLAAGFPEHYGADAGGTRYAPLAQITPGNLGDLSMAWTYRTGDLDKRDRKAMGWSKFQVTPILADGRVVLCTSSDPTPHRSPGSR